MYYYLFFNEMTSIRDSNIKFNENSTSNYSSGFISLPH